jgi:hypothetical protein
VRANQILQTTCDPAIVRKLGELHRQARDTEVFMHDADRLAHIDREIEKQSALVNSMAKDQGERAKKAYAVQRARLTELQALTAQQGEAQKAVEEMRVKLADLKQRVAALEESRLQPKNQEWAS